MGVQKTGSAYEVKIRQFWYDFDVFAHFGIRMYWFMNEILILSRSDNLEFSVSSSGGRSDGRGRPKRPKIWHGTLHWSPRPVLSVQERAPTFAK